ncbi:heparinase II/III family protein [Oceaniglobus trochenteri]|uniref:heparinase II/III family protein n=1 Tax=Oceaniglobus trochenteri TaxID=2763260 RepID=UPI001CFF71E1|nr:heparinase II/III family protein [Oceaniglobus trochenteri]
MHVDETRLAALRDGRDPVLAGYRDALVDWVDRHRDWTPPRDLTSGSRTMEVLLEESAAYLTNAALAALITQEPRHLDLARTWARALARLPGQGVWANNYAFGVHAAGLGRALVWLHDDLDETDRAAIAGCIAHCVTDMVAGSYRGHEKAQWWAEAYLHHDHWIATGGYGEAALAVIDHFPEAGDWAERARDEFATALSWLGDDGGWLEGVADLVYAWSPLLAFYGAYRAVTGQDLHGAHPWLQASARFRLHHLLPDGSYVYCNDSFRSGRYNTGGAASCHVLRRLASVFGDGHVQWLADHDEAFDMSDSAQGVYEAAYEGHSVASDWQPYVDRQSVCVAWNALWHDGRVAAVAPGDLDPLAHFDNQGMVVMRSDWTGAATLATLSCGPLAGHRAADLYAASDGTVPDVNINHAHIDHGAITLFTKGRYVLIPAGYGRRDSGYQNTLSVDGAHFVTDPAARPRIQCVAREGDAVFTVADFTEGFGKVHGIESCRRSLLSLGGDTLFLVDDLRRRRQPSRIFGRMGWHLHHDPRVHSIRIDGATCDWVHGDAIDLRLTVLAPAKMAWETAEQHDVRTGEPFLGRTSIMMPEWREQEMTIVTVLAPPDVSAVAHPVAGGQGVLLQRDGRLTLAIIAQPGDGELRYTLDSPHDLVLAAGGPVRVHLMAEGAVRVDGIDVAAGGRLLRTTIDRK